MILDATTQHPTTQPPTTQPPTPGHLTTRHPAPGHLTTRHPAPGQQTTRHPAPRHVSERPSPAPVDSGAAARLIAVGVRDPDVDAAALEWAAGEAVPGYDTVHLVHAYNPMRLDGCAWEPVRRARDLRRGAADRLTAVAVQRLTAAHPDLFVDGSSVTGPAVGSLIELSEVVDLLVVGDDRRDATHVVRHAWAVQEGAYCPVVGVPPGWTPDQDRHDGPVTLVLDDHGMSDAAMIFAARAAARAGTTLQVSRAWASLHEGEGPSARWLAHQQEEMDTQLSDWRLRFPAVAIAARIELGARWRSELSHSSRLLVTGRRAACWLRSRALTDDLLCCPIAVVPDHRV